MAHVRKKPDYSRLSPPPAALTLTTKSSDISHALNGLLFPLSGTTKKADAFVIRFQEQNLNEHYRSSGIQFAGA